MLKFEKKIRRQKVNGRLVLPKSSELGTLDCFSAWLPKVQSVEPLDTVQNPVDTRGSCFVFRSRRNVRLISVPSNVANGK